jgi:hypothetical protein
MTKIKSYPSDLEVTGGDKWIGTDVGSSNRTKNFTANKVGEYFNKASVVNVANQLRFMYDTIEPLEDRASGTISFATEIGASVSLSEVSEFILSERTTNGKVVVDLLESYIGKRIAIQKVDDPNTFGYYTIDSYEESLTEPGFYEVELTHVSSNGDLLEDEFYFISLVDFNSVDDKHYTHNQSVASQTWNINHNLSKFPSVTVTLSSGQVGYGDITYINNNSITITFAGAESGKAYIN